MEKIDLNRMAELLNNFTLDSDNTLVVKMKVKLKIRLKVKTLIIKQ